MPTGRALMVLGKDLGQCGSVALVSRSLEAVLPVLFKCYGSIVGQGPPDFSVSVQLRSPGLGVLHTAI